MVELRSDTFTTPTDEMRAAMANAEVGNDHYGEDPTVNRLESLAAGLLGMEAAVYVPSGTMANQLAVKVLSTPGTEVLCPARSHVFLYEAAAAPMNSGVQLHPLWNVPDGIVAAVEGHGSSPAAGVDARAREHVHGALGRADRRPRRCARSCSSLTTAGSRVHVDGARIWNAAIALGARRRAIWSAAPTR